MRDPVVCVCPCRSACECTHASMCVRKTAVPQAACVHAVGLQTRDETPDAHNALDVDVADVTRLTRVHDAAAPTELSNVHTPLGRPDQTLPALRHKSPTRVSDSVSDKSADFVRSGPVRVVEFGTGRARLHRWSGLVGRF